MAEERPFGSWSTPITPAALVEQAVGLSHLHLDGEKVFWVESRPSEAGRDVLVCSSGEAGTAAEVLPAGFSVRTQVHEYGGRCYDVRDGLIVFSNWSDQRLWALRAGWPEADAGPEPLTPEPAVPRTVRFADPVIDPGARWVFCVRETHGDDVVNDLVAVPLDGGEPVVLAHGHDFFSAPRPSPDGRRLAWLSWDHPDMPWDGTELHVAALEVGPSTVEVGASTVLAGGRHESVSQPRWSPDGVLHYVSDRTGWWNVYDETGHGLQPLDAEFAEPDWVFGQKSYGFDPDDGRVIAAWRAPAGMRLGPLGADPDARFRYPFTSYTSLTPAPGGVVYCIAGSPAAPPALVRLHTGDETFHVLRRSREVDLPARTISVPEAIDFPTGGGDTAHALYYPPANADFSAPAGELPPVLVVIHGGPTSSASAVFNLAYQYWTSRGFAVADVDYRGSTGYGREYRNKLRGTWGVADVEDCQAVVAELAVRGLVDGSRAVIRGGSAGGFTTLAALAFTDRFAAGASLYGVADLELLARDTHKFEARYLDSLIGPWPDAADTYQARSPIHHIDGITSPLILFQGLEDKVVPPEQSQVMYEALKARRIPVAYLAFEGEQHGFRRAETITAVASAELEFYGRVLGFEPALDPRPDLDVAGGEALGSGKGQSRGA